MEKKIWFLMMIVASMAFFAACGQTAEAEEEYHAIIDNAQKHLEEEYEDEVQEYATSLYAYFLQDLDYMLNVLENNFVLFDVAYWARGVDIRAIVEDTRIAVLNNPEMDASEFYFILEQNFAPLFVIGHFEIMNPRQHYNAISGAAYHSWFYSAAAQDKFRYPRVLEFYESRHPGAQSRSGEPARDTIGYIGSAVISHMFIDRLIHFGEHELSMAMASALEDRDYEALLRLMNVANDIFARPNVSTYVLEEGKIAYLSVNNFGNYRTPLWAYEEAQILDFFGEIRNFEHLIIDLRRNHGGSPRVFYNAIMGPNITERHNLRLYAFAMRGDYSEAYLRSVTAGSALERVTNMTPLDAILRPVPEMLAEFYLPELNLDDMERMDYGFIIRVPTIMPMHQECFDNEPVFGGKVWLLSSEFMTSAAELSAWAAAETGFATIVGDITGGALGGSRTWAALPNTGILFRFDLYYVTNGRGRPLEAGTMPHHFNRPGMDALETTLALIEEGKY